MPPQPITLLTIRLTNASRVVRENIASRIFSSFPLKKYQAYHQGHESLLKICDQELPDYQEYAASEYMAPELYTLHLHLAQKPVSFADLVKMSAASEVLAMDLRSEHENEVAECLEYVRNYVASCDDDPKPYTSFLNYALRCLIADLDYTGKLPGVVSFSQWKSHEHAIFLGNLSGDNQKLLDWLHDNSVDVEIVEEFPFSSTIVYEAPFDCVKNVLCELKVPNAEFRKGVAIKIANLDQLARAVANAYQLDVTSRPRLGA